ncbi:MAG: NADH-quinone oxidoreductase subunit N [Terriglobia bacterium]
MNHWNVSYAMPEWILAATAMVALVLDARSAGGDKRGVKRTARWGVLAATVWVVLQGLSFTGKNFAFYGHYSVDAFSMTFKLLFGVTALFVLAMADTWLRRVDKGHGEFHLLTLFATLGMFFISSGEDLASLFVALELITVSFYCLTAFKRNDERSIEAAVKYVVLGALASSFLILGIAFIYGAAGSLELATLARSGIAEDLGHPGGALVQFGVLLALVGLGFKVAAVPFQVWTPDVYEGAASPVTAFLSMGSKAAGFVLLLKLVRACLGPAADAGLASTAAWVGLVSLIAAATVLYGNLGAIWQGNMKRLLGYSSIGHAGYALMGLAAFDSAGFAAVVYYLIAYLFTVLGVFAAVVVVNGSTRNHEIADYAGLGKRSPFLALVLTCCLLSLAGVPPFGGFFGKFMIFDAIVAKGSPTLYALAFVGVAGVVISLYYYLKVIAKLYVEEPKPGSDGDLVISRAMRWVLYACLAGVFLTGILQPPFVALAKSAAHALIG